MKSERKARLASVVVADSGVVSEQFKPQVKEDVPDRTEVMTKTVTEIKDGLEISTEIKKTVAPA